MAGSAAMDNTSSKRREKKRKKAGMKPRSRRNRKRPRSQIYSNDNITHETYTRRLELHGKPLGDQCSWIRIIKPYPYTFSTFAKERWFGRELLEIYNEEFGSYPRSYYENAILQGRILVSDQKVEPTYAVKGNDVLTHTVHRHEPAVAVSSADGEIQIVKETDDLVVVDKPGTLPVHPCGGYHVNSLLNILEPEFGKLYTINRLDRLTSGLVILAKESRTAQDLGRCLMERDSCQKLYLARVRGKFPTSCNPTLCLMKGDDSQPPCRYGEWLPNGKKKQSGSTGSGSLRDKNGLGYWITDLTGKMQHNVSLGQVHESQWDEKEWLQSIDSLADGKDMSWFHLACPTRIAVPKDGICEAGAFDELEDSVYANTVKPCETAFGVVRYDPQTDSTIVLCRPVTGRTHQIRLHLQFLGHPISNDPNYGGSLWYGDPQGEETYRDARAELDAMDLAINELRNQTNGSHKDDDSSKDAQATLAVAKAPEDSTTTDTPATEEEVRVATLQPRLEGETLEEHIKKTCVWCARSRGDGNDRTVLEFLVRSRGIWLHALQYNVVDSQGKRLSFQTEMPSWTFPAKE